MLLDKQGNKLVDLQPIICKPLKRDKQCSLFVTLIIYFSALLPRVV